jgi:hypothetical protein
VEDLLNFGKNRPSWSKFNSTIYAFSKPIEGMRIVHDFGAINQETVMEPYSMKKLQESIEDQG